MTTAILRIPAKFAQISVGHLGYGVDILAQVRLDLLADAMRSMEHDDTDPSERPMNADQCRDALLRELLGGWSPSELVEAKIPAVLEMADQIATLTRERDEARAILRDAWFFLEEDDHGLAAPSYQAVIDRVRPYATTPTLGAQP